MGSINGERNCDSLRQRLLNVLFGTKEEKIRSGIEREMPKIFSPSPAVPYLNAQCPSCKNIFGVSSEAIQNYNKKVLVFRYNCPYCGFGGRIEN